MRTASTIFLALVWALAIPAKSPAQADSGITVLGKVLDARGHGAANITVGLKNLSTEAERVTTSGPDGAYEFSNVAPGDYMLIAEVPGFAKTTQPLTVPAVIAGVISITADIHLKELEPAVVGAAPPRPPAPPAERKEAKKAKKAKKERMEEKTGAKDGTTGASADRSNADYSVVRVFYATDRLQTGEATPNKFYGGDRAAGERLAYGHCDVSIPKEHRLGKLERPSFWRRLFHFPEDPKKFVVLLSIDPQDSGDFYAELVSQISQSSKKDAFVFIHGYNVTFADAARRTAQLAYDLAFEGAPIFYSWPSKGDVDGYPADEASVQWTVPHLKNFLREVAARSGASTVHLVAHSMGNRALTDTLLALASEPPNTHMPPPHFREVILAAPDIDAGVFKQLAKSIESTADRITLYASSKDKALMASEKLHAFPRAGESGDRIVVVSGIDTVDATAVDTGFLGHSYFADRTSVVADIFALFHSGSPPDKRGLLPAQAPAGTYWLMFAGAINP